METPATPEPTPQAQRSTHQARQLYKAYLQSVQKRRTTTPNFEKEIKRSFIAGLAACLHNVNTAVHSKGLIDVITPMLEEMANDIQTEVTAMMEELKNPTDETPKIIIANSIPSNKRII